ncbi:MAG: bacteriocin [Paludibacteraceae bacterium]
MKTLQRKMELLDKKELQNIKGGGPRIEYYYENGVWKWRIVEDNTKP